MIPDKWYAILPSVQVKKGHITAVRRFSLDLALFRTESGSLGCVTDQCSHRGAALSKGKVSEGCIRCPFHALSFDPSGKCTFVPANGRASTEDNSRYNVRAYPIREAHGIVFVWYGNPDQATEQLPFFNGELNRFVYSEMEDHWNTHYSRAIENQLDVVHVPIVHYNTIGRGNRTLINGPKVVFEGEDLITSANNEVDHGQMPKKAEDCIIKPTYLRFRFPNLWMNHISDRIRVVIYFAPVDDENTILYIRFYNRITGLRPVDGFIAFVGKFLNRVIERQDKRVVVTQRPRASSYRSKEHLLKGDGPIIEYCRLRDRMQTGASE